MKNLINTCSHLFISILIQFGCYTGINDTFKNDIDSSFAYTKHLEISKDNASIIWLGCNADQIITLPIIGTSDGDQSFSIPVSSDRKVQFNLPPGFSISKSRILPAANGNSILCAEVSENKRNELFIFRVDEDGYQRWNLAAGLKDHITLLASISSDMDQTYLVYQSSHASKPYVGIIEIDQEGVATYSKVLYTKDEMSFSDIEICLHANHLRASLHSDNETIILNYNMLHSEMSDPSNVNKQQYHLSNKKLELRERSVIF